MHRPEIIKFLILRTAGNFFLLFALTGITFTFGQALYQEGRYRINVLRGVHFTVSDKTSQQESESRFKQQTEDNVVAITPVDTNFSIVIPKIGANSRIIPNVDPANYNEYMGALRMGVAHAAGTVFPGMNGNVYLFAHSTDYFWNVGRYNAVFYLLKELEAGDEIDVFFEGKRFIYIVAEKRIVKPSEVEYITQPTTEEQLTLQTCWPPGTTLERLLVIAKPKGQS